MYIAMRPAWSACARAFTVFLLIQCCATHEGEEDGVQSVRCAGDGECTTTSSPSPTRVLRNVFFINLAGSIQRRAEVERELSELNWVYERYPAVRTPDGRLGCSLSHLGVLELARDRALPYVVVLEDDVYFTQKSWFTEQVLGLLANATQFDVLIFGGNVRGSTTTINPNLARVQQVLSSTGYLVQQHYYDTLIDNIRTGSRILARHLDEFDKFAIDVHWHTLQHQHNWLMIMPRTVTQRVAFSTIDKRVSNAHAALLDDPAAAPTTPSKSVSFFTRLVAQHLHH